jgi:hypothetical protein
LRSKKVAYFTLSYWLRIPWYWFTWLLNYLLCAFCALGRQTESEEEAASLHGSFINTCALLVPFRYLSVISKSGKPSEVISPICSLPAGANFSSVDYKSATLLSKEIGCLTTYFSSCAVWVKGEKMSFILFTARLVSAQSFFRPKADVGYP